MYSQLGIRIMATALVQPDEQLSSTAPLPLPIQEISKDHHCMMAKLRRSEYNRNIELIVSNETQMGEAWVMPDDPCAIYILFIVRSTRTDATSQCQC